MSIKLGQSRAKALLDADFFVVFGADNSTLTFLQLYISNKNT
jgi:hypothetical protein